MGTLRAVFDEDTGKTEIRKDGRAVDYLDYREAREFREELRHCVARGYFQLNEIRIKREQEREEVEE